ncbi:MAG: asparaginase, partial [Gemmatimonadetes bacterium]|nr:asparaginase [Gemmatimonadota bacterium]
TSHPGVSGVLAVLAGRVLAGHELRKLHNYRIDAFSSGDAGALACIEEGRVRALRPWPAPEPLPGLEPASLPPAWPWVEIVHSHAGAQGRA